MAKSPKKKTQAGPDLKAFFDHIQDISQEKGLDREEVLEVVKGSLVTAFQKKYGPDVLLEVILDQETPEISVIVTRNVVERPSEPVHISLEEAKQINPDAVTDTEIKIKEFPFDFSRIGATNVRQVLLQRLKELEREIIYNEFASREGELIHGSLLRWRDRDMFVDLGRRVEGILPRREQIPNEKFHSGDRIKAVIKSVELRREKSREPGPYILLSRSSADFVRRLFELEIPEIYEGIVDILDISRIAGYRTKIMVASHRTDVDPVGACVGIKGVRIQSIVRELGNERIDIIPFSERPEELIASALSPARVLEVRVSSSSTKEALAIVPDDPQIYSLAIGVGGNNVRLASQLTGYKLAVKTQSDLSTPEVRAQLEAIFRPASETPQTDASGSFEDNDNDFTPLSDLPGLSSRLIDILESVDIRSVEQLIETDREKLAEIRGVGKSGALQILKILEESVEYEEA